MDTGTYFGLDSVGSRIWALMGDGSTQSAIVTQLENEYTAERHQLKPRIADHLRTLEAQRADSHRQGSGGLLKSCGEGCGSHLAKGRLHLNAWCRLLVVDLQLRAIGVQRTARMDRR